MSFLQGKTPISFLQELCTKRGITPQYDLIANEGAVHEPTFVFKVTAGEFIGTGKGPSKKKAKHNAALSVLNQMVGLSNGQAPTVEDYSEVAKAQGDGQQGNPVGELQELTQKRLWRPPVYEFTSEQGPPHARQFICTVHLWKLIQKGTGKSKKLAKRNAASAMLTAIREGMQVQPADGENVEDYDDDSIPLPLDHATHYQALKEGKPIPALTPGASQQITQFYQGIKNQPGKNLSNLGSVLQAGNKVNYIKILEDVSKDHRFDVSYVDIQERSQTGQCQSLVQLSSMPIAVCYGSGASHPDARMQAALSALHYLRIMTKK